MKKIWYFTDQDFDDHPSVQGSNFWQSEIEREVLIGEQWTVPTPWPEKNRTVSGLLGNHECGEVTDFEQGQPWPYTGEPIEYDDDHIPFCCPRIRPVRVTGGGVIESLTNYTPKRGPSKTCGTAPVYPTGVLIPFAMSSFDSDFLYLNFAIPSAGDWHVLITTSNDAVEFSWLHPLKCDFSSIVVPLRATGECVTVTMTGPGWIGVVFGGGFGSAPDCAIYVGLGPCPRFGNVVGGGVVASHVNYYPHYKGNVVGGGVVTSTVSYAAPHFGDVIGGGAVSSVVVYTPPSGGVLYANGTFDGETNAYTITSDGSVSVSNDFVPVAGTTDHIEAWFWLLPGDTPTQIDWALGTSSFGSDVASGTVTGVWSFVRTNADGFDVWKLRFPAVVVLTVSSYWLTFLNAFTAVNNEVFWDQALGASNDAITSFDGSTIPGESFIIDGS